MNDPDIRWKQRQTNFERAMLLLENALQLAQPDVVQRAGIIKFFEMSFELSWKLLKDYLEAQGFAELQSPRGTIKQAFASGMLADGHTWMELLADRNLATHTYDEARARELELLIRKKYFPVLKALRETFRTYNG